MKGKEMTASQMGRKGGSRKVPKGFAKSDAGQKKAQETLRKSRQKKRLREVEKAARYTVRSLSALLGSRELAETMLQAIRSKRVCHVRFKVN